MILYIDLISLNLRLVIRFLLRVSFLDLFLGRG